jgi:protein-disulfide isomerase
MPLLFLLPLAASLLAAPTDVSGQPLDTLIRDDGRVRGNAKAPVTLIEYSDFTCGFCQKFFRETWPRIQAKYIETGKVRFLYRDYPRAFQGPGLETALAARCAGDQNRYWAMHDRLFEGDRRWGSADIERHARAIGLDSQVFSKCLREARHEEAVFRDRADGVSLGLRGTPGFVLLRTAEPGKESLLVIPGAFPFDVFEEQIERLLGSATKRNE